MPDHRKKILLGTIKHLGTLIAYVAVALLGLRFASVNINTSPIWFASGFAIAVVWHFGRSHLLPIYLGTILVNLLVGAPVGVSLAIGVGNTLEALVGVYILSQLLGKAQKSQPAVVIRALVMTTVLAPWCSSIFGIIDPKRGVIIAIDDFAQTIATMALGNASGIMFILPFFLLPRVKKLRSVSFSFWRDATIVIGLLASLIFVFFVPAGKPWLFMVFPFVLIARIYWGQSGSLATGAIICLVAVYASTLSSGPFTWDGQSEELASLQLFLISVLSTSSLLGISKLGHSSVFLKRFLLLGWTAAGVVFYMFFQFHEAKDNGKFESLVNTAERNIEYRMKVYEHNLRAASAFLSTQEKWSRANWHAYFSALDVMRISPGIRGMGVISTVPRDSVSSFGADRQREGLKGFQTYLSPESENPLAADLREYLVVRYVEPLAQNQEALGLILNGDIQRRSALRMAAKNGAIASTAPIKMVQDHAHRKGIAMYFPVNHHPHEPAAWVFTPLVLEDFFTNLFNQSKSELDYWLFYDQDVDPPQFVYGSQSLAALPRSQSFNSKHQAREMMLAGNHYQIIWAPSTHFPTSFDLGLSFIAGLSAIIVLFIGWIILSGAAVRENLEVSLQEKTAEIVERESMWRTLTSHSPVGIVIADLRGRCTYVNPKWEELAGISFAQAEGNGWSGVVHAQDLERLNEEWAVFIEHDEPWETLARFVRPDKTIRWISLHMSKIYGKGQLLERYIGVVVDRTQEMEQTQIIESERLRLVESAKMASLGRMAGGIAHEINNPLTIISAKATQILRHIKPDDPSQDVLQKDAHKILSMIQRISRITRGLRTFSRDSHKDTMTQTSLRGIVDDTLELCRITQRDEIVITTIGNWDIELYCRPAQISQVLVNLISNARDAVANLKEKWINLEAQAAPDHMVEIRVTDSGTGIDPNISDKILDPFFTTKDIGKGTGLGLSIAIAIVEDHRGSIRLDSCSPHTSFVILLPLDDRGRAASSVKRS